MSDATGASEGSLQVLLRIADALERIAPPPAAWPDMTAADTFVWEPGPRRLKPVHAVARVDLRLLLGVNRQRSILLANTLRFAAGLPANNAMLWGARGTGKSSLVKAVHAEANGRRPGSLILIELMRDDIRTLPVLLGYLRELGRRTVILCDDLSFEREDADYKALKSVLDGGVEGRPANVLLYATSNRRHLMPRDMIENERGTAISPSEATEEKVSLSDRFGIWLGFHNCDQDTYLAIVEGYAADLGLDVPTDRLRAEASEWAIARGARSGRVAWQFIQDVSARSWPGPEAGDGHGPTSSA